MKQMEDQLDLFANADKEEEPDQHKEGKEDTKNKKHSRSMLIVLLPDECHEDDWIQGNESQAEHHKQAG